MLNYYTRNTPAMRVLQCRHTRQFSSQRMNFEDLINEYGRMLDCSDQRDGIYALLSLLDCDERLRLRIVPVNSLPPFELLLRFVPKLCCRSKSHNIPILLSLCTTLGLELSKDHMKIAIHSADKYMFHQLYRRSIRQQPHNRALFSPKDLEEVPVTSYVPVRSEWFERSW
jgi:hypothetical protein